MSKNAGSQTTLMYVDNSIPLWAFFDLYGTTTKICLLGTIMRASKFLIQFMINRICYTLTEMLNPVKK